MDEHPTERGDSAVSKGREAQQMVGVCDSTLLGGDSQIAVHNSESVNNHNDGSDHSKADDNDSTAEMYPCALSKDCGDGISTKREVPDTKTFLSLSCQTCGKFFNGQSQLRQHAKVCQIDFHCQNCGKIFTRSSYKSSNTFRHSTGRHRRTCKLGKRTKKKPYYCEICGKFTGMQAWMLKRHLKSCSSERVCHICEKIFKSNNRLQNHRCTGNRERGMEQVIVNVEVEVD